MGGAVFRNALLHMVNKYSCVKKEGTFLLGFFIGKEC